MAQLELHQIQQWIQSAITHPDGVLAGIANDLGHDAGTADIEAVIRPSREMSSLERLKIYGRAYFGRLIECLQSQFPAVHHAIGEDAFNGLAFGYLIQHPSTNYSLGPLGGQFDDFLKKTRPTRSDTTDAQSPDFADFLVELARLERVYGEVFNGKGPECHESLAASDLVDLTADEFADSRMMFHECVRLLTFHFPVHEYVSSVRRQLAPSIPLARPVNLVVTRRDYVVRRFEVTKPQFVLLSSLINQSTVGESIQTICSDPEIEISSLEQNLRTWFRDWAATPLFARRIDIVGC